MCSEYAIAFWQIFGSKFHIETNRSCISLIVWYDRFHYTCSKFGLNIFKTGGLVCVQPNGLN